MGIALPAAAIAAFDSYYSLLEKSGKSFNLTTITGVEDVARLHFLDSLALLMATDFKNAKVIDIGSGAGFPGLPLKLAEASIDLALLDATAKRIAFLSELCAVLEVAATCLHARAEEAARELYLREQFDIAVSRAVAQLSVLSELCLPFVRVGGIFLAMKGIGSSGELEEALGAIHEMGAEYEGTLDYALPETNISHRIIKIRKISPTPKHYPRRFAKIQKSPITLPLNVSRETF